MSLPIVYHPSYVSPLPPDHRFPMLKFGKLYEYLIRDGIATLDQFHYPTVATREQLLLAHAPHYIDAYQTGTLDGRAMRRIGLPWSAALVERTCTALGGTLLTVELALQHGLACNTAGGTHHAFYDFGSGFCIFNDLAVAARWAQQQGWARRVLIVDLDVHQGDGTAALLHGDPNLFTFSMHCAVNFPFHKQQSDLDIELPAGMGDAAYLAALHEQLPTLLDTFQPDLILYDGAVDPHVEDQLGKLALSNQGLYDRDHFVLTECVRRGRPVAGVIGGGYQQELDRLARRHTILHRAASDVDQTARL